jgi:hypothetical protein
MARYYLGDLGYALDRDDWDAYCNREELPEGAYSFRTYYGDGTYVDNEGREIGVDSGTIGILPADKISDKERLRKALKFRIGHIIEIEELSDEDCFEEDGVITLGNIVIDTSA